MTGSQPPDPASPDHAHADDALVPRFDDTDPAFERLLQFLRDSRGFDFTGYKRPSLVRRVRHRMREAGVAEFEDYQDALALDPAEFDALFDTILINVTSFFRDSESWQMLREQVLPELLARGGPIRVWSAGCATGQEPYTVAMLLHDELGSAFRGRVKIYATDVDETALAHARAASYEERELRGLPETLRERYFEAVGDRWVFTPDLRRSVIFGRNDLTRDAPISRIDLLLCRNTLMYFNAETQSRVVDRLAFALRPEGTLFLGKAEMLLNHAAVFDPVDLKRRFFRRMRGQTQETRILGTTLRPPVARSARTDIDDLRGEAALHSPVAQLVVAADGRLAMVNHRAAALFGLSDRDVGRPFPDLEVSYRPLELRAHLATAFDSAAAVRLREVEWRRAGDDPAFFDIHLTPLVDAGGVRGVGLTFSEVTRYRQLRIEVETTNHQLESAYEELQSTNEELETTNEELQSTVEELETTNEELQSTNEELETMNEELQSANDELQSANVALRERTDEVDELNAFMRSVLGSLQGAVVVLDRDLIVRVWTQQASELWGLRDDETVGVPLAVLDSGLPQEALIPLVQQVLRGERDAVERDDVVAVNRRGRSVRLQIVVTALGGGDRSAGEVAGALVMMSARPGA